MTSNKDGIASLIRQLAEARASERLAKGEVANLATLFAKAERQLAEAREGDGIERLMQELEEERDLRAACERDLEHLWMALEKIMDEARKGC